MGHFSQNEGARRAWISGMGSTTRPGAPLPNQNLLLGGRKLDKSDHFPGSERVYRLEILAAIIRSDASPPPLASESASSACHQVEDQNDQRHNEQKVNQATGNMKTEAQKPQNQNDDKNCPEHRYLSSCIAGAGEPEARSLTPAIPLSSGC